MSDWFKPNEAPPPETCWVMLRRCFGWGSVYLTITKGDRPWTRALKVVDGEKVPLLGATNDRVTEGIIRLIPEWGYWAANGDGMNWVESAVPHVCFRAGDKEVVARIDRVPVPEAWARAHGAA